MTNWETHAEELKEFFAYGYELAVGNGKIKVCESIECSECDFSREKTTCFSARWNWLNAEAAPTLTADERKLCELLKTGYIAQDDDDNIYHYNTMPRRVGGLGMWDVKGNDVIYTILEGAFGVSFEGICDLKTKAWAVEDLLALEVRG